MAYESFANRLSRVLFGPRESKPIDYSGHTFREFQDTGIQVESWSDAARTVQVRGYTKNHLIAFDHNTNADRSKATTSQDTSGVPEYLIVQLVQTHVIRGRCYVRVTLTIGKQARQLLCSGYVHDGGTLAWPNGVNEAMNESAGVYKGYVEPNPGAGNDWIATIPLNVTWRIVSIEFSFSAAAGGANRVVVLQFVSDVGNVGFFPLVPVVPPATNIVVTASAAGTDTTTLATNNKIGLPTSLYVLPNWTFASVTTNLAAGDVYSNINFTVEEWIAE